MALCTDARRPAHVEIVEDDAVGPLLGGEVQRNRYRSPVGVTVLWVVRAEGHAHRLEDLGVCKGHMLFVGKEEMGPQGKRGGRRMGGGDMELMADSFLEPDFQVLLGGLEPYRNSHSIMLVEVEVDAHEIHEMYLRNSDL